MLPVEGRCRTCGRPKVKAKAPGRVRQSVLALASVRTGARRARPRPTSVTC